jgi:hypothetical protein
VDAKDRPMTHEERVELINRPIVFHYIGGCRSGGTGVQDPTTHTRVHTHGAYGVRDDDPRD